MFQGMRKNNIIIFSWQLHSFKKRINELYFIAQFAFRNGYCFVRSFHAGYVIEIGKETFCKNAFITSQFQKISRSKERLERPKLERMHDIKIKSIGIVAVRCIG